MRCNLVKVVDDLDPIRHPFIAQVTNPVSNVTSPLFFLSLERHENGIGMEKLAV